MAKRQIHPVRWTHLKHLGPACFTPLKSLDFDSRYACLAVVTCLLGFDPKVESLAQLYQMTLLRKGEMTVKTQHDAKPDLVMRQL